MQIVLAVELITGTVACNVLNQSQKVCAD